MADLTTVFAGVRSPNPFWLASAPPTNTAYQINKAFEYGWGGAVWKTIGDPVLNVCNRYGSFEMGGQKLLAINNVELISDRPLEVNLREIAEVKRLWPDRAVVVSAMVSSTPEAWRDIVLKIEDTGADAIETGRPDDCMKTNRTSVATSTSPVAAGSSVFVQAWMSSRPKPRGNATTATTHAAACTVSTITAEPNTSVRIQGLRQRDTFGRHRDRCCFGALRPVIIGWRG